MFSLVAGAVVIPTMPATAAASPTLTASAATCDLLGATDVLVQADGLVSGEKYTVRIDVASDHSAVDSRELSGDSPTASFPFVDVPNGNTYVVSIENATNTVASSTTVSIPVCDLPTLAEEAVQPDATVRSLANTGSASLMPTLAAVGLVQLGVVLLGASVMVSRLRSRGA